MKIWLPHLEAEPRISSVGRLELARLARNIDKLSSFRGSDERIDYILELYCEYEEELKGSDHIPSGQETSASYVDLDLSGITVSKYMVSDFVNPDEERTIFFFADSHSSTYSTLSGIDKGPTRSIVCFDAHDDLSAMDVLWKGNVFTHLISSGAIGYLVLAGVNRLRTERALSRMPEAMRERVLFSTCPDEIAVWLQAKHVDETYLSFDLDVLRSRSERLTSMEYCPFTVLLNVSASDPERLNLNKAILFAESCIRPPGLLFGVRNLYHLGEDGLSSQQASSLLDKISEQVKSSGIRKGFQTKYGLFLGEIVELNGPDIGQRTSSLAKAISRRWKEGLA